ncbi:MAG: DNA gyrase/topoisomerase IV subunit A [Bacteroidales bacterium]|jgi:topoisomerase-4 subunit A|nr:DNA gyrase/topoisomerase IV subunit A [Bacteroidales bacterium]
MREDEEIIDDSSEELPEGDDSALDGVDESEELGESNNYTPHNDDDAGDDKIHHLGGMYQHWFLDYASYVILERAVPHLADGLKPVQRRILHAMNVIDDGRYNKVANIVGQTMQYHPHGDASIGDALVQMGQKELLIDTQGNWGNILTGDDAAAPRYIEARLSKFALEVVFNNKITPWQLSYDGRKKEPINLPIKFPLLLAQGVEGIAVGLSSKILPHNFNELLDASIAYLRGEEFQIFPDFPTGGLIDVSKYHDGQRGGSVKIRSRIEKIDQKTLRILDVPFGKTTDSLLESIKKANDKGKIKIRKFDDYTASHAEIVVHLMPGVSSDKTIDALYAFTDCEVSISPNCCVIYDKKPHFLTVSDVLRRSADNTKDLLRQELEVQRGELLEHLMTISLEKIFIEERIYKDKEYEQAKDLDTALAHIDKRLEPYKADFVREVTRDDLLRLEDIKMSRIHKFSSDKADEDIANTKKKIKAVEKNLKHLTDYTIQWFEHLKEKYGADHPRLTEIRSFDSVDATKVIESNLKLYHNPSDGFIGTGLKPSESSFVCNCSEIDEILIIYRSGQYKVVKVADKIFVGKDVYYVNVYRKSDQRTIYNVVYRDGKGPMAPYYIKRFNITSVQRDKVYDITLGRPGSKIAYMTANLNGEAEVLRISIKSLNKIAHTKSFERDFAEVPIRGRGTKGLLLTRAEVQKITVKEHGGSTLGGRPVWWDADVQRINYDKQGQYLGEFMSDDKILVVLDNYEYYLTSFDDTNHYETNVLRIEKYDPHKVWTIVMKDWETGLHNLKRFTLDAKPTRQSMLADTKRFTFAYLTDTPYPRLRFTFAKPDDFRAPLEIEADDFIAVKSAGTKGKKVANWKVAAIEELEPTRQPEVVSDGASAENNENPDENTEENAPAEPDSLF